MKCIIILFNYITFVLLVQKGFAGKKTVPVFMIDPDQVMGHIQVDPNPFAKISALTFSEIIHDSIKRSERIVIFIEDTFSSEDISTKDKSGTAFFNLHTGLIQNIVKYFPAVIEPYKQLNKILQPQQKHVFYVRTRTRLQLVDNFKYIYVFFQDGVNETRSNVLRRHDAIIKDVLFVVRQLKPGPVISFYTGKLNPVVVRKTEFVPIKPNPLPRDLGIMVVSSGALFRFSGVFGITATRRAMFNQLPMVAGETIRRRSLSTRMAYTDFDLEFNFSFKDDGWLIDSVSLIEAGEEVGRTDMGVGAPWNWSYVCGEPLIIVNTRDGSSVTISQYQIQPRVSEFRREDDSPSEPEPPAEPAEPATPVEPAEPAEPVDPEKPAAPSKPPIPNKGGSPVDGPVSFGTAVNCGPYFNTNILSGLFVAFLILCITMYGVVTLMDCKSNDRYEDPQGKPLEHDVVH